MEILSSPEMTPTDQRPATGGVGGGPRGNNAAAFTAPGSPPGPHLVLPDPPGAIGEPFNPPLPPRPPLDLTEWLGTPAGPPQQTPDQDVPGQPRDQWGQYATPFGEK